MRQEQGPERRGLWCQKEETDEDEDTRGQILEDLVGSGKIVRLFPKENMKTPKGFNLKNLMYNLKSTCVACGEWKMAGPVVGLWVGGLECWEWGRKEPGMTTRFLTLETTYREKEHWRKSCLRGKVNSDLDKFRVRGACRLSKGRYPIDSCPEGWRSQKRSLGTKMVDDPTNNYHT